MSYPVSRPPKHFLPTESEPDAESDEDSVQDKRATKSHKAAGQKLAPALVTKAFRHENRSASDSVGSTSCPQQCVQVPAHSDAAQLGTPKGISVVTPANQRLSRVLDTPKSSRDLPESGIFNSDIFVNF